MFEIKDLKYKEILNIPSLTLDKDVSCIVGASGAGKKAPLLRMLNRLFRARLWDDLLQWRNACFDPAGTIAKKGFNAGADSDFAWRHFSRGIAASR